MITREVGAVNNLRPRRLAEAVKEILAEMLREEIKDPRIGFVTITGVEASGDLKHVKVFISVLGDEHAKADSLRGLESACGFIRTEIGKRIRLRHTPEIIFRLDNSIERGAHIFNLLREVGEDPEGRGPA